MDETGQVSPDGRWFWNGQKWQTTTSPDAAWRWDGAVWQPTGKVAAVGGRASDSGFIRKVPGFRSGDPGKMALGHRHRFRRWFDTVTEPAQPRSSSDRGVAGTD